MPDDDSITPFFQKAIELDPAEISYLLKLSDHFAGMGEPENAQQLLLEKMDNYEGEEKLQVNICAGYRVYRNGEPAGSFFPVPGNKRSRLLYLFRSPGYEKNLF